ncbi:TonB-dependent receptor [Echinicola strongylocentroti]|uniref:TonB-dependent receptor n=1 Tax=Echinicola strongylocentroti TaxID=1795355 RepID=A0A2Z4IEY9_9BACT|nr:TonB-dependent receptor [Echinicola strongylocentroti]AWW29236.1 TonB-dependent receptor [Echinicola strongylocentroti]
MRNHLLRLILCGMLALVTQHTFGQDQGKETISGLFPGVRFSQFVSAVESKTSYRFFYKDEDVDSLSINVSAKDNELEDVLDLIFEQTALRYTIDGQQRVFIHTEEKFPTSLASGYFERDIPGDSMQDMQDERYLDRAYTSNKLWTIGHEDEASRQGTATLRGKVISLKNGEPIIGAVLFEKQNYTRAVTDEKGQFSITLPKGRHTIHIQHLGQFQEQRQVELLGDGSLLMQIDESIVSLDEIIVSSDRLSNINRTEMGVETMSIASMKRLPSVMGEVDVIKSILTLPGVKTVGESSVGFNVRGGAADQNLILLNDATIYNPSHLFGFFSSFNGDMVDEVALHKAGMPAQYGDRLSSVLDVKGKYGNREKFHGQGGIGLLTSRLTFDGPIGDKTTFLVSGRATYSDWLLDLVNEKSDLNAAGASFYDLNLNLKHYFDDQNELSFSSYWSQDDFNFVEDTVFNYSNRNANLKWKHYFNDRLESEFIVGVDQYKFGIEGYENELNAYRFDFDIEQYNLKARFTYDYNDQHSLYFGMENIYYKMNPGNKQPLTGQSIILPETVNEERAMETAFYLGDRFEINDKLTTDIGVRYVFYHFLGPNQLYTYADGLAKSESTITGEETYDNNEVISSYSAPEIRISGRYIIDNFTSIKAGYHTTRQYIHLLSNTSSATPTDTWKLSDPYIRPQQGNQFSLGFYKDLIWKEDKIEASVEVYYRGLKNLIDYRSGAELLLNNDIEQDVLNTDGRAYGVEFQVKKSMGKLNGWLSYTYSKSELQTSSDELAEKINGGSWYPSNFDQPHAVMLAVNYELSKRANVSLNTNYSTGRPITLPVAKFYYNGAEQVYFSDRNAYRIPDYFRIDLAMNLEGSHKVNKPAHASWSLGVYNLLGRSNPYSVYFTPVNGTLRGYQLSIYAQPIPYITYNFKF